MKIRRKIEAARLRFYRKQRQSVAVPPPDETQHTCRHCHHTYVGRQCPMCGMPGNWNRFTWKGLLYGFLDIWGLGNRPMFRSMGHLLWRPGYMIRDYLGGHYLSYFPPFKMLAVLTVFVALAIWMLGIDTGVTPGSGAETARVVAAGNSHVAAQLHVLDMYHHVKEFLLANILYRVLLQVVMMVVAMWIVFRRKGFNLAETFFVMVYLSCQMQLLSIGWLLLTRESVFQSLFPYVLPEPLVVLALALDFRQLFHLGWWETVWRTLLFCLLLIGLYVAVMIFLFVILFAEAAVVMG